MSSEKVWYRFEAKGKDGSVWKLRIQDLPLARLNDAVDLLVNVFARDEPLHRAAGIAKNPRATEMYRMIHGQRMSDPSNRIVICCSDDTPEVKNLIGLSMMVLNTSKQTTLQLQSATVKNEEIPQEQKKLTEILYGLMTAYNPVTELNLDVYYEDRCLVVDPHYRGLGISENFLKVRRLMCNEHGVPMTCAWMTAFGSQIAGARDGWETVKEIEYDDLANKYDVTFTSVPRTVKFMIVKVDNTGSTK